MHCGKLGNKNAASGDLDETFGVETVPGHQSDCFAGERREKRGLK